MDKYNCNTCRKCGPDMRECDDGDGHCDVWEDGIKCADYHDTMESTEPQHMHPCAHGTPIVASAIASVTFIGRGRCEAHHDCADDAKFYGGAWNFTDGEDGEEWVPSDRNAKFCQYCGLRLPSPTDIAAMYADQQGEGQG